LHSPGSRIHRTVAEARRSDGHEHGSHHLLNRKSAGRNDRASYPSWRGAFYVLQGATLETADGKQITLPTGASAINRRDVPHAGLKVLGNTPFKYLAVHIVDKGAKLYDAPPK
jgi:hypothetical protein